MERRQIAERLAAKLFDAESKVDAAASAIAALSADMLQARQEAGLSMKFGQSAVADAAAAFTAMTVAQDHIIAVHGGLEATRRLAKIGPLAIGAPDKPLYEDSSNRPQEITRAA